MNFKFLLIFVFFASGATLARAQQTPAPVRQMIGTWSVAERMWPGAGAAPMSLPPATAERHLAGDALLQEVMKSMPGAQPSFTRTAWLNYNAITHQYEYTSWDTRAPQIMAEKGTVLGSLDGGKFVAPQWGKMKNVAFRYRLEVGGIHNDRQIVRLFLTPESGDAREFEAFEYVYTKVG